MAETTDTSFLEEKKTTQKIHVKDILFTILRNLHWLVLCGAVGAAIAGFQVRQQNRIYRSSARILIVKTTTSTNSDEQTLREATIKNMFARAPLYNSNVNNEMMIFTSKSALLQVARDLKLNTFYTSKTRYTSREKDLYGESPFTIDFIDNDEDGNVAFTATAKDDSGIDVTLDRNTTIKVPFSP